MRSDFLRSSAPYRRYVSYKKNTNQSSMLNKDSENRSRSKRSKINNSSSFSFFKFFITIILLSSTGCSTNIANCECEKMDIYYISPYITSWGNTSEREIRKHEIAEVIEDKNRINEFFELFKDLKTINGFKTLSDTRILIDLYCKDGSKSVVTANIGFVRNNQNFYETDSTFLQFFEPAAKKQLKTHQKKNMTN